MSDNRSGSSKKFNWLLTFAILFGLIMLLLSVRAVIRGLIDSEESGLPSIEMSEPEPAQPDEVDKPAEPRPDEPRPARASRDIESIQEMEQKAAEYYDYLRRYSRENPDAIDARTEEQIREMEREGSLPL